MTNTTDRHCQYCGANESRGQNHDSGCPARTVAEIEVFFLSTGRYWVAAALNPAGDEIGEPEYLAHKTDAVRVAHQLAAQHGDVPVRVGTRASR